MRPGRVWVRMATSFVESGDQYDFRGLPTATPPAVVAVSAALGAVAVDVAAVGVGAVAVRRWRAGFPRRTRRPAATGCRRGRRRLVRAVGGAGGVGSRAAAPLRRRTESTTRRASRRPRPWRLAVDRPPVRACRPPRRRRALRRRGDGDPDVAGEGVLAAPLARLEHAVGLAVAVGVGPEQVDGLVGLVDEGDFGLAATLAGGAGRPRGGQGAGGFVFRVRGAAGDAVAGSNPGVRVPFSASTRTSRSRRPRSRCGTRTGCCRVTSGGRSCRGRRAGSGGRGGAIGCVGVFRGACVSRLPLRGGDAPRRSASPV